VTVNGQVAWNGTAFTGAAGIASADTDGQYVYFRGVAPGNYTAGYSGSGSVPGIAYRSLPGSWSRCATENGVCAVSGPSVVAYGAGSRFNYVSASAGVRCDNTTFGDPSPNVAKWCYVAAPTGPQCAVEGGTCSYSGLMTVAYGANGAYKYATLGSGGTACTNAVFGDPAPNTAKACSLLAPPPTFTSWTSCAPENGTCSFSGTHEVAFGVNGHYSFGSFTGGTPCTTAVFGDPAVGQVKACYLQ